MSDERKPMANITPFGLRMQPDLKSRIEAAAKKNERSMNAEIVARLEDSFAEWSETKRLKQEIAHYQARERVLHRDMAYRREQIVQMQNERDGEKATLIGAMEGQSHLAGEIAAMREQMAKIGEELAKLGKPGEPTEVSTDQVYEAIRKVKAENKKREGSD